MNVFVALQVVLVGVAVSLVAGLLGEGLRDSLIFALAANRGFDAV